MPALARIGRSMVLVFLAELLPQVQTRKERNHEERALAPNFPTSSTAATLQLLTKSQLVGSHFTSLVCFGRGFVPGQAR